MPRLAVFHGPMIETDYQRIHAIMNRDTSSDAFFKEFVRTFAEMTQSELGLAWNCTAEPFTPTCQVLRDPDVMVKLPLSSQKHQQVLAEAWRANQATLISPPSENGERVTSILLGPLRRGSQAALVEFLLPAHNESAADQQAMQMLAECCRLANQQGEAAPQTGIRLEPHCAAETAETADASGSANSTSNSATGQQATSLHNLSSRQLDEFTQQIHVSLDHRETAGHVVNEMRRVLDCDRVTVFEKRGKRFRTLAISGQPDVNRRSNLVRALRKLVEVVLPTERAFWFPAEDEIPPQIESSLHDYIALSLTRSLAVIPVFDREESQRGQDPKASKSTRPELIGGIVIEQSNHQWERAAVERPIETLLRHSSTALRNSHHVGGIFMYPALNAIGKSKVVTSARNLPKTLLALAAVGVLTLAMVCLPWGFQLGCEGEMTPKLRQRIFADQDGSIQAIHVTHGAQVAIGDVLLELENDELEIQFEQLSGELAALQERLSGSRSIRINQGGRQDRQNNQNEFNPNEIRTQIESLERRLTTVGAKKDRLRITSPIPGQVQTWDIMNRLRDRPVKQGDLLLEVADTNAEWELELDLPDRKVGHLMRALAASDKPLKVEFTFAADPGKQFFGTIRDVARSTAVNADRLHIVRVKVDIEEADIAQLKQAGSTVRAKISCGERSLAFVLLHEAWEFVQYHLLFRFW